MNYSLLFPHVTSGPFICSGAAGGNCYTYPTRISQNHTFYSQAFTTLNCFLLLSSTSNLVEFGPFVCSGAGGGDCYTRPQEYLNITPFIPKLKLCHTVLATPQPASSPYVQVQPWCHINPTISRYCRCQNYTPLLNQCCNLQLDAY